MVAFSVRGLQASSMSGVPLVRRLSLAVISLVTMAAADTASAASQVDLFDHTGRRTGQTTISPGANHLDLRDSRSNRMGYGVKRQDGSWDLYHNDGSRLGTIQAPTDRGYPSRITIERSRRKK